MKVQRLFRSVVVLLVLLPGLRGGTETLAAEKRPAPSETRTEDSHPEDGAQLASEADSVDGLGIARAVDGRATVLVARGPEGDAGRARRALDDGPDRPQAPVVTSAHTRSELAAARRTLDAYAGGSAGQGHAFGIYFDAAVDAIAVVTDAPVDHRQALQASMGKIVDVRYGTGDRSSERRQADNVPHWGGAGLYAPFTNALCTAGFAISYGGIRRAVTSSHCVKDDPPGSILRSGQFDYAGRPAAIPAYPAYDFTALTSYAAFEGRIYNGDSVTTSSIAVAGAGGPCVGCSPYFFSGQATGTQGGHTVQSLDATFCKNNLCTSSLVLTSSTLAQALTGGNSGAALYARQPDTAKALVRGLGVGVIGNGSYFENWLTISNYYGATIVTG